MFSSRMIASFEEFIGVKIGATIAEEDK